MIKNKSAVQQTLQCFRSLTDGGESAKTVQNEIIYLPDLLKQNEEHNSFKIAQPIEQLKYLKKEHKIKAVDLPRLLGVSEGLVSECFTIKKDCPKTQSASFPSDLNSIRRYSTDATSLEDAENAHFENAGVMNTKKNLVIV